MRRLAAVVAVMILVVHGPAARAFSGVAQDARQSFEGGMDIRSVSHADTASEIEYAIESWTSFNEDELLCEWSLDLDGDRDADYFVTATTNQGGGVSIVDREGRERGVGTVSRTSETAAAVRVPLSALAGIGTSYSYVASCAMRSPGQDEVPKGLPGIVHNLGSDAAPPPPPPPPAPPPPPPVPTLECPGHVGDLRPDVLGTAANDWLQGVPNAIVCGLGGNDVLVASSFGGTLLDGGDGADLLCARQGAPGDVLDGGTGIDRGRADNDELVQSVEHWATPGDCG